MKLALVLIALLPTLVLGEAVSYRADAYDQKTGKFLYSENHTEIWEKGKHIETDIIYRDTQDNPFARRTIEYKNSYTAPRFILEDFRSGLKNGAEIQGTNLRLFKKDNKDSPTEEKLIPVIANLIIDGGFDYLIRTNFNELVSGKSITGDFAVVTQLNVFSFNVVKHKETILNDRKAVVFKLVPNSFLLKMLVSDLFVTYDLNSKRLIVFEGTSNIESAPGKSHYKTRIVFNYPGKVLETALK